MRGPAVSETRCIRRVSPHGLARLFGLHAIGAVLPLVLLACGSPVASGSLAPRASGDGSAAVVVAAMSEGGLTCEPVSQRPVATYVADAVACAIDGKDVIIRSFASGGDRDRFLDASAGLMAQMSADVEALPTLVGPTWIVTADDEGTVSRLRTVLGGEIR